MQMNRKTLLLSLRVETVASHPVQDIYYNRSCRCSTGNLMCFELTAMKLILQWYFFFSFGFVIDCQENRYGLKGSSIQLSISPRNQSHQQGNVKWRRFNRRDYLGDKDGVPPRFKKRMSLNNSDWSLTIQDLQEDDGGLYEALSKHEDVILAAFTLIVENTVSKPIIKVNQYDFNSSAACRATVNCSADGSWATYDCDQNFCAAAQASQSSQSSQSSINITVTAVDSSGIKCNAKNHVSKNHSTAPNIRCLQKQQDDFHSSPPLIVWIIVTVIGGVFLGLVMGVIVVFVKRRKCSKVHPQSSRVVIEQHHETIYCTVEKPAASQTSPVNNAASNKVETIYDTPSRHMQ
ncbi:uncharacterized protein si:ch1073-220m6.1 isoform X2 [Onychostoma macrolepis]|uniref:uncharacterized protein si:ch1073-220m6.1 isoform X2 n=1 Tax=Onychostoma macrolepis TaxID=369639 RepID=UPI00272BA56C|nr:uncharacterized protein si:ch1073-220m6.1 isoform X2 [Onychostoma macrolepis]